MGNQSNKPVVTIQDIAEKLQISPSSVSRALNNNSRISIKTRELVWKTARELGYQPKTHEYFYEAKEVPQIGVIVPDLSDSFYRELLKGIQDKGVEQGYNIFFASTQGSVLMEDHILRNFSLLKPDGIIISYTSDKIKTLPFQLETPIVNVGNINFELPGSKIIADVFQAVYISMEHLYSLKCKRTALIASKTESFFTTELIKGFKSAHNSFGLPFRDGYIIQSELSFKDVEMSLDVLLNMNEPPDSIISCDNHIALHVLFSLKKRKINVPSDISVMSIGSEPFNEFLSPSITVVRFPAYKIGRSCFKKIEKEIKAHGNNIKPEKTTSIHPADIVIGGSTLRL